jgi:hypothetical protein
MTTTQPFVSDMRVPGLTCKAFTQSSVDLTVVVIYSAIYWFLARM